MSIFRLIENGFCSLLANHSLSFLYTDQVLPANVVTPLRIRCAAPAPGASAVVLLLFLLLLLTRFYLHVYFCVSFSSFLVSWSTTTHTRGKKTPKKAYIHMHTYKNQENVASQRQ